MSVPMLTKMHMNGYDVLSVNSGPWRVCTKMVTGSMLLFKIWFPQTMSEPAWSDGKYARVATVPPAWHVAGKSGWYAGHIPPGGTVSYGNLSVTS